MSPVTLKSFCDTLYLCTLSLTMGLYTYFNVPGEFISLNPTNVLATLRPFLALIAFYLLSFLGLFFLVVFFLGDIKRPPNRASTTQYLNLLAIFITLCAIFGGYYLFFYIGKSAAENEDTFYVIKQSVEDKNGKEVVLLGNYGDYLVGIPFDSDTKEFESFVVLKMPQSDTTRLTFTHKKVGKLQRVKSKSVEAKP